MSLKKNFSPYEVFVVGLLTFLQFTIILDFMILSPLGAILMKSIRVTPVQFGMLVSVYAFSAGISGIVASGFADKYDRKNLLLFFYSGFILGTFLCAEAKSFEFLFFARMLTGLFGGVIGSIVFAITTDLFPMETRGRVMGFVQTAFAGSQILGTPLGLFLANHWGWQMPFLLIVSTSIVVAVLIWKYLKPIRDHINRKTDIHPFHHFLATVKNPFYRRAFLTVALLSTGGFMMMPFGSAFSVHNLGIDINHLPMVYMVTGISSMVFGPLVGRASDRYGKFKTFLYGSGLTVLIVLIYSNLGTTPIGLVMLINALMFLGITARMISSQSLMSGIPTPQNRGAFMSISSSTQQISGGFAALIAGMIVTERPDGYLENFNLLGLVVVGTTLVTLWSMYQIHQRITEKMS